MSISFVLGVSTVIYCFFFSSAEGATWLYGCNGKSGDILVERQNNLCSALPESVANFSEQFHSFSPIANVRCNDNVGFDGLCVEYELAKSSTTTQDCSSTTRDSKLPLRRAVCGRPTRTLVMDKGQRSWWKEITMFCDLAASTATLVFSDPPFPGSGRTHYASVNTSFSPGRCGYLEGYGRPRFIKLHRCQYATVSVFSGEENCAQNVSREILETWDMPLGECSQHHDITAVCSATWQPDASSSALISNTEHVEVKRCAAGCDESPFTSLDASGDETCTKSTRDNDVTEVQGNRCARTDRVQNGSIAYDVACMQDNPQTFELVSSAKETSCQQLASAPADKREEIASDGVTIHRRSLVCGTCNFRHGQFYKLECNAATPSAPDAYIWRSLCTANCSACEEAVALPLPDSSTKSFPCTRIAGLGGTEYLISFSRRITLNKPVRVREYFAATDATTSNGCLMQPEGKARQVTANYFLASGTCVNSREIVSCLTAGAPPTAVPSISGGALHYASSHKFWIVMFFIALALAIAFGVYICRLQRKLRTQHADYVSMYEMNAGGE